MGKKHERATGTDRTHRVLVVGCGGIGGVVSAALGESADAMGLEVVPLTTNADIATAIESHGLRVRGVDGPRTVKLAARTELAPSDEPFDFVLLATQPPQVEDAARRALPWLADDGAMVCFQNGLCEERVARIVGDRRVIGAVVAWGASMPEPGVYERTSAGGFTIGRIDGSSDEHLSELALVLEALGPVNVTRNLQGARWSKLAINCAISTLGTIGGARLGTLMVHRHVRRLALEIMTEAVEVARCEQVRLEKVAGTIDLEWMALTEPEKRASGSASLVAKHSMLLAVGARYRRMRSSMLSAIERGRPPAVDFLNGEVVDRGKRHGVPTPVNAAARDLVHLLARRELEPSLATLRGFADRVGVRAAATAASR